MDLLIVEDQPRVCVSLCLYLWANKEQMTTTTTTTTTTTKERKRKEKKKRRKSLTKAAYTFSLKYLEIWIVLEFRGSMAKVYLSP